MQKKASFDVVVIGTGSAGFSAIEAAVSEGAAVCAIERGKLGGECPNFACVPSKAILKAASVYRTLQHARDFGIQISSLSFDFTTIMKVRSDVVDTMTGGGEKGDRYEKILSDLGVEVKYGNAKFLDDHMIDVNGEYIYAKTIVIATGTADVVPPIDGIDTVPFKSWKDAILQKRQPKSMAIIGGGPVGCELATFYTTFGTRVVLLQRASQVLSREDAEIAAHAHASLTKLGIDVRLNADIDSVIDSRGGTFGVRLRSASGLEMIAVDQIVVTAGKRAAVDDLNLEEAGVLLNAQQFLKTTKEQRTSVSHIFAAGDVDGGLQFTHTAHHEGWIAGYNAALVAKKKRRPLKSSDERVVPRVTFLQPEVASVGMTTEEAKKAYQHVLIGRSQIAALGRAVTEHARTGMLKLVVHPKTRKILGGHMIGERAGEVIHEVALAIFLNATVDKLAEMIHAYPTFSEAIAVAASSLNKE